MTNPSEAARPVLVYLPGLHGDATLFGNFRRAIGDNVQLIEIEYPPGKDFDLRAYAQFADDTLRARGVTAGWIVAESFGSQVFWEWSGLENNFFKIDGAILAGGFAKHPYRFMARLQALLIEHTPALFVRIVARAYIGYTRARFRTIPDSIIESEDFLRRRTPNDMKVMAARSRLVADYDPSGHVAGFRQPLFLLSGLVDPIVFWPVVFPALRNACPGYRASKLILSADHAVLVSTPTKAAKIVLGWITSSDSSRNAL